MLNGLPTLSHEQQQKAVERIQALMQSGISSGQAIAQVAEEIRQSYGAEVIHARFEDDDS